jgi:cation:H+ antiporter
MTPAALAFNLGVLASALVIITLSGNYFVDALISYARKLGLSNYFIGMVVVAIATSSPDIVTSIMGLLAGRPEILSGVVIGGLMIDTAFLNGLFAMLSKKIKIDTSVIKGIEFVVLGLILLPYILMIDGEITRSEGIAMVLSFIIYVMLIWHREQKSGKMVKQVAMKFIWQDAAVFLLALGAMLIASRFAVYSVINLSAAFRIPIYLLSITVLAVAAALPDGIAGVLAIVRGKGGEIGFGENIGTTMLEINLFTGLVAIFTPMHFGVWGVILGVSGLILCYSFFLAILRQGAVTRQQGFFFLGVYGIYLILEVLRTLHLVSWLG